jgi:hypothetical protein
MFNLFLYNINIENRYRNFLFIFFFLRYSFGKWAHILRKTHPMLVIYECLVVRPKFDLLAKCYWGNMTSWNVFTMHWRCFSSSLLAMDLPQKLFLNEFYFWKYFLIFTFLFIYCFSFFIHTFFVLFSYGKWYKITSQYYVIFFLFFSFWLDVIYVMFFCCQLDNIIFFLSSSFAN